AECVPMRVGTLNSTTRGKVREIGAARTVTTGPHHERHAKASLNIGLGGRHGSVETHRKARLCGTYLGNMTKGRAMNCGSKSMISAPIVSVTRESINLHFRIERNAALNLAFCARSRATSVSSSSSRW